VFPKKNDGTHIAIKLNTATKIYNTEYFLSAMYISMYNGNRNMHCNLNENDIPRNMNESKYFFFIRNSIDIKANATYIESH
jgi:hypothetical protein